MKLLLNNTYNKENSLTKPKNIIAFILMKLFVLLIILILILKVLIGTFDTRHKLYSGLIK